MPIQLKTVTYREMFQDNKNYYYLLVYHNHGGVTGLKTEYKLIGKTIEHKPHNIIIYNNAWQHIDCDQLIDYLVYCKYYQNECVLYCNVIR